MTIARSRAAAQVVAKVTFGAFLLFFTLAPFRAATVPLCRPYTSPPSCSLARSAATGELCFHLRGRVSCRTCYCFAGSLSSPCLRRAAVHASTRCRRPTPSAAQPLSRSFCGLARLRCAHTYVPCVAGLAAHCFCPARGALGRTRPRRALPPPVGTLRLACPVAHPPQPLPWPTGPSTQVKDACRRSPKRPSSASGAHQASNA